MTFSIATKKSLKSQYTDNLVRDFYKPLLGEARLYQRVSGYFSSAGLDLYAEGLEELAKNDGQVEFIVSKRISESDFLRIQKGYNLLNELQPLRLSERNERLTSKVQNKLGNLAFLIAAGRARVKIALTQNGLFHDKFGIITSGDECVFFNGSVNETQNGISRNYESISVDVSWDESENVKARIEANSNRFMRLWNDEEPNVKVIEASQLVYNQIAKYQYQTVGSSAGPRDEMGLSVPGAISFYLSNNQVVRVDQTESRITESDRKLRPGSDISHLFEQGNVTVKSNATYSDIERIIKVTKKRADRKNINVIVSDAVKQFILRNKYSIEKYKILGDVYKGSLENFPDVKRTSYDEFSATVQHEVSRPLKEIHMRAAYYEYEMARAANFSVPGAGKTAMLLGVFAYLNRQEVSNFERVKRLFVICPINAFDSWRREFQAVFGTKKELHSVDVQTAKDFDYQVSLDWNVCNLILVNYEALPGHVDLIKKLLDNQTLLVFDEVHRIKNPEGKRARAALEIARIPEFRYVMTGTPIPNRYLDIYNFLHILYGDEYNAFFGWNPRELVNPSVRKIESINSAIHPFFWRTNKDDLQVPPADPDILKICKPSEAQSNLAEAIYGNESSSLAILIRLIQASTNPSLLEKAINYDEMMSYDDDGDVQGISKQDFNKLLNNRTNPLHPAKYADLGLATMVSPKFQSGIELVLKLVSEGKKVMVWGIFVDTLIKITKTLRARNISVNLVYGETDKNSRTQLINDFRDGNVQVLVSNPQTLAESISLHQSVHDAVYFECDFNLTFMLQSRDRIHRLGLKPNQHTRYYYLQTQEEDIISNRPGFIDQKIYRRLKDKEQVMYGAVDDNTISVSYSQDEILDAIHIVDEERNRIKKRHD